MCHCLWTRIQKYCKGVKVLRLVPLGLSHQASGRDFLPVHTANPLVLCTSTKTAKYKIYQMSTALTSLL